MQSGSTTKRCKRKVNRICSFLKQTKPDCTRHIGSGHIQNASGSSGCGITQWLCNKLIHSGRCSSNIQLHTASLKGLCIDTTQRRVGIGNRWFSTATLITDRTRFGSCADRTHTQGAGFQPCNTSASSTNRADLDHWQTDRQSINTGLSGLSDLTITYHGNI